MEIFFNKYILSVLVPVLLIGLGIFFLFYLRFFFIAHPKKTFSSLFRKGAGKGISQFRALTVALAGTLGVGNIVGVASAIIWGGPGALFWMWVSAFSAMVLKYAEIVLAHKHRRSGKLGEYGGAMYYIQDFYRGKVGKAIASFFAMFCILNSLSMGCMLQANAVSGSFKEILDIPPIYIGILLAFVSGIVVFRNIYDISPLTSVIIPLMTGLYIIMSLVVIWKFRGGLGYVLELIIKDAFSFSSASSGLFGFLLCAQLRYGTMRGLLSNEAGCGTAPMAHASSRAKLAAEQGIWGIIEVFVDTILLCTLTGISILLVFANGIGDFCPGEEMKLVIASYSAAFGGIAGVLMTLMVFMFAYATIICWAYYGIQTLKYLTGHKSFIFAYKVIYTFSIVFGALSVNSIVWQISDIALGCMTVINVVTLWFMRKEIKRETSFLIG